MATTIEEQKRARGVPSLVAQIPTDGYPAVAANNPVTGTELSRNVSNTLMAIPGASPALGAMGTLGAASKIGQAASGAVAATGGAIRSVAPVAVPVGAAGALSVAAAPTAPSPQPVSMGVPGVTSTPATLSPTTATATAPAAPAGIDLGGGVTRINGGSSPLFTNMPGAGIEGNANLMARGVPSTQNQGAMDGIQARQDTGDRQRAAKAQYDAEVAANNPDAKTMLLQQLNGKKLTARGAGVLSDLARTDATSATAAETNKIAQGRFGIEKAGAQLDQAGKQQLQAAQTAFINAKTPAERVQAESVLRALQQKYEKETPNRYTPVPGGQMVVNGQLVVQPGQVLDNQTGQWVAPQGAGQKPAVAEGSISTVNGKSAKYIGGKWVPQ